MTDREETRPCEKCQGFFPANLPVCPFCGKQRGGAETTRDPQVVGPAEDHVVEAMSSVLEQGCPNCQGSGRPLPIFVETWFDEGYTLTGKQKYTVRSADVPGYCPPCSSWLGKRRWLAAALMAAPLWVLALAAGWGSGGTGVALIAALYGLYLVRHLSYSWADYLLYGLELQMNLQGRIARFSPEDASVHFPVGCLHTILRAGFICITSLAVAFAGELLLSGRPVYREPVGEDGGRSVDQAGKSPFDMARTLIDRRDSNALAELVRQKPELRGAQEKYGASLMHFATDADDGSMIADLAKAGCQFELPDKVDGFTPLHWAARNGKAVALDALLRLGAQINPRSKVGHTPLHLAALQGQQAICEILVKNLAEVNPRTQSGKTPLSFAKTKNFPEIAELLKKSGGTP